jgi:uncharacterized membrane protein YesL
MKGIFSTEGIAYRIMTAAYQLIILNLLWCIASIPIVTVGASTTALFYVVGKIVRKEEVHEVRDFVKVFRSSFKQATGIWLILCLAYLIIFTNLSFAGRYESFSGLIVALQLPVLLQVIIVSIFVFPLLSRYEANTIRIIKVSWILGIKHIFSCLASLAIVIAVILLAWAVPALILTVLTSLTALAVYFVLNRVLEKYRPDSI